MKTTVQARLDEEDQKALETLTRRLGMTPSEVVRVSLRQMLTAQTTPSEKPPKFIGIGKFDSGIPDLSTNKKYMEDFGLTRQQRLEREKARKLPA
jgi:Ribbon-helix-helix protein, copG family